MRSSTIRDHSAALRSHFDEGILDAMRDDLVGWFSLRGTLGESHVWAAWTAGRLRCHPSLMTQARLLVKLGTVFEHADHRRVWRPLSPAIRRRSC